MLLWIGGWRTRRASTTGSRRGLSDECESRGNGTEVEEDAEF